MPQTGEHDDDVMIAEVRERLAEWGWYQREEPGIALGYPRQSIESRMRRDNARSADKSDRRYWIRRRGSIAEIKGKQTRVMTQEQGPEWPQRVIDVDQAIARIPHRLFAALRSKYIFEDSLRIGAEMFGVPTNKYRTLIDRAEWAVVMKLEGE